MRRACRSTLTRSLGPTSTTMRRPRAFARSAMAAQAATRNSRRSIASAPANRPALYESVDSVVAMISSTDAAIRSRRCRCCGARSASRPISSASVRIVVSGVRISWSRLAANSRSRSTMSSTRSRKRLNVAISTPASSPGSSAGSGRSGAERAIVRVAATIGPTAIAATPRAMKTVAMTQTNQSASSVYAKRSTRSSALVASRRTVRRPSSVSATATCSDLPSGSKW